MLDNIATTSEEKTADTCEEIVFVLEEHNKYQENNRNEHKSQKY